MTLNLFFAMGGFGLNFNLFETNILNWAVVIFGLYKFLPNLLGSILKKRRESILTDLKDAETRLAKANDSLKQVKQDLACAEEKAEKIRKNGQLRAEAIRLESEKLTVQEMARIKQGAASDLTAEASRVSVQLRREAARLAIEKALNVLPKKLDNKKQNQILNQSILSIGED